MPSYRGAMASKESNRRQIQIHEHDVSGEITTACRTAEGLIITRVRCSGHTAEIQDSAPTAFYRRHSLKTPACTDTQPHNLEA